MFQTDSVKVDGIYFCNVHIPSLLLCPLLYDHWIGQHQPWDSPLFDIPWKEYCDQIKYDILQILDEFWFQENLAHLNKTHYQESINGSSISSYNIFGVSHFSNSTLKNEFLGTWIFFVISEDWALPMDFSPRLPSPLQWNTRREGEER